MASPWQTIRALRAKVAEAVWPDGTGARVIGENAARITADAQAAPDRLPFALLNVGQQTADQDDPALVTQEFALVLAVSVPGHDLGEHGVIGGPSAETDRWGFSTNRGLLEVERPVLEAVQRLNGYDGLPIEVRYASAAAVGQMDRDKSVVWRTYTLAALCTRTDEYPAPRNLVATGGSGQIVLTWDLPPSRFDLSSIIVRYASGATAPASSSAGTPVTLGSDLATGVTISGLAAGTYSVAAFAKYQDTNASDLRYSDQDTGSTRLSVVVT